MKKITLSRKQAETLIAHASTCAELGTVAARIEAAQQGNSHVARKMKEKRARLETP
jgi:hypothetical protein